MNLKPVILISALAILGQSQPSLASKDCTQGPHCDELKDTVQEVKTLKEKRHSDVKNYGKKSPQVQEDDQALKLAIKKDQDLRTERRQASRTDPDSPNFRRSKHRQRKRHKA